MMLVITALVISLCFYFEILNDFSIKYFPVNLNEIRKTDDEKIIELQSKFSNLPFEHWLNLRENGISQSGDGCSKFPNLYEIHYNNEYWQVLHTNDVEVYIMSAYLDIR